MREETMTGVVAVPAEALWEYLTDYGNVVRLGWAESSARPVRSSRRCTARYAVSVVWDGIRNDYIACLEDPERPKTLLWSTRDGMTRSWVRFDLASVDAERTTVDVTLHYKAAIMVRELESVTWELLRPALVRTVASLERLYWDPSGVKER